MEEQGTDKCKLDGERTLFKHDSRDVARGVASLVSWYFLWSLHICFGSDKVLIILSLVQHILISPPKMSAAPSTKKIPLWLDCVW